MRHKPQASGKSLFPALFTSTFLLNLGFLCCTASVAAQVSNFAAAAGEISGTVRSQADNRPASQVMVNLKASAAGVTRRVLTDANGDFEARGLPTDTYEVAVEEPGFEPYRGSALLSGASAKLDVYLKPVQSARPRQNYTVSVRELRMSRKAQEEYQKGLALLNRDELEKSMQHFTKAAEAFPGFYEAYYHKGVAEMRLGHRDAAMENYQAAVDLSEGKFAWAEFAIGYLLCSEGKPSEAERVIRHGLEAENNSAEGHTILANTLMSLDRPDEAEKSIREALLRDPNFADAYLVHSNIAARKKDFQARLQDLDTYLRLAAAGPAKESALKAREATLKALARQQPEIVALASGTGAPEKIGGKPEQK